MNDRPATLDGHATASSERLVRASPREVRAAIRVGAWSGLTTGLCLGYVQANLAAVPVEAADEFRGFCLANSDAMPLLAVTGPGDPEPRHVARRADLRTDLPRYRIFRYGQLVDEQIDATELWRDDLVGFLIGCSFSTEAELLAAGVPLRNIDNQQNEPIFRTSIECVPFGRFHGPIVVSMRPIPREQVETASRLSSRYPLAHGGPVHVGDPASIGIADLSSPDWGDAMTLRDGDVPVFWACGVTPQAALADVGLELVITHAPGHMFITDLRDADIRDRSNLSDAWVAPE